MLYIFLLVVHTIISLILILLILSQSSKGGALGGAFGGATATALGGREAPAFLKKWTRIFIAIFAASCVFLTVYVSTGDSETSNSASEKLKKELAE